MPDDALQVTPPLPTMDEFLSDYARRNPDLAWMTQMIAAQRQMAASAREPPEIDALRDEIAGLHDNLAQAQGRVAKLTRIARRLEDELADTHALVGDLAAAFGACGLCWGADAQCPSCRGRGRPGRFAPDPELRARLFAEPLNRPEASRANDAVDQPERR